MNIPKINQSMTKNKNLLELNNETIISVQEANKTLTLGMQNSLVSSRKINK